MHARSHMPQSTHAFAPVFMIAGRRRPQQTQRAPSPGPLAAFRPSAIQQRHRPVACTTAGTARTIHQRPRRRRGAGGHAVAGRRQPAAAVVGHAHAAALVCFCGASVPRSAGCSGRRPARGRPQPASRVPAAAQVAAGAGVPHAGAAGRQLRLGFIPNQAHAAARAGCVWFLFMKATGRMQSVIGAAPCPRSDLIITCRLSKNQGCHAQVLLAC